MPFATVIMRRGGAPFRIGAAISRRLSGVGFSVLITCRGSGTEARELAREIGGKSRFLDLRQPRGFSRLARILETEYGRLDLLVHNAAVFPRTPAGSVSREDWDAVALPGRLTWLYYLLRPGRLAIKWLKRIPHPGVKTSGASRDWAA